MKKNGKILALILSIMLIFSVGGSETGKVSASENDLGETLDYGIGSPRVAIQKWDTVTFGNYWQKDTNRDGYADEKDSKTPIKWRVLEEKDGVLLLISDKILDESVFYKGVVKQKEDGKYYTDYSCTWETSDVRSFLNDTFMKNSFTEEEQGHILVTDVVTPDHPVYGYDGGNDTRDKVFLLSSEEIVKYGFNEDSSYNDQLRQAKGTPFVMRKHKNFHNNFFCWWLRSPSSNEDSKSIVWHNGGLSGHDLILAKYGIRPVIRVESKYVKDFDKVDAAIKGAEWDSVVFGSYEGKDINWRVLNVDGNDAFLLCDKLLLKKPFNDTDDASCWQDSTIREWLNNDFYNDVFTDGEKKAIKETVVDNSDNLLYSKKNGEETNDKVFLLSLSEIEKPSFGFPIVSNCNSKTREAVNDLGKVGMWWLRTSGDNRRCALGVVDDGYASYDGGRTVNAKDTWVRPALHVDLSKMNIVKGEVIKAGDSEGGIVLPLDYGKEEEEIYPYIPTPTQSPTPKQNETPIPTTKPENNNTAENKTVPAQVPTEEANVTAPSKVKLGSVKKLKGKKLTVKWKKTKGAVGYEVQYAVNSKFSKSLKTKNTTKQSITLKKLKKKKTYYVRVRAYKIDKSGKKVCGSWSKAKKIKM